MDSFFGEAEVGQECVTLGVKHNIIRLEVSVDNISFVKVLYCQENLSQVETGFVLVEASLFVESSTHVSSGGVVQQQEQLLWSLEGILQADDEGVSCVGQHISFGLSVLDQVLTHNLLLVEYLHSIDISSWHNLLVWQNIKLFDNVDLPKAALAQLCSDSEVFWSHNFIIEGVKVLADLFLPLLSCLPDLDEFLLPPGVFLLVFFWLLLGGCVRLLSFLFNSLDEVINIVVLIDEFFVNLLVLRHQFLDHVNSVVVPQDTLESCSSVLVLLLVHGASQFFQVLDEHLSHFDGLSDVGCYVAVLVTEERIYLGVLQEDLDGVDGAELGGQMQWSLLLVVLSVHIHVFV